MQGEKADHEGEGEKEVGETHGATHEHDVTRHDSDDGQRVDQHKKGDDHDKKEISASDGRADAEKDGCQEVEEGHHDPQPIVEGTFS